MAQRTEDKIVQKRKSHWIGCDGRDWKWRIDKMNKNNKRVLAARVEMNSYKFVVPYAR